MWGLEYGLLFGLPENKLELIDGRSRCMFPFLNREQAEHHFVEWLATLRRWQGAALDARSDTPHRWRAEVPKFPAREPNSPSSGKRRPFELQLHRLPLELTIPFDFDCFCELTTNAWRTELWDDADEALRGIAGSQHHYFVALNLWSRFRELASEYGGKHGMRCDVILSDRAVVQPDLYYYRPDRDDFLVEKAFFRGPPDLIVEVVSPASTWADRGPRKDLYERSGVRELWLVDPSQETVEPFTLHSGRYELQDIRRMGDRVDLSPFPGESLSLEDLFDTQWKRDAHDSRRQHERPEWIVPPEVRLGLEHLLLMGHHDRRYEIWNNQAPCVLMFGSEVEAQQRFREALEGICRWESCEAPAGTEIEPGCEAAEVGRFRLVRRQRRLSLDVAVDARKYEQMARVWHSRGVWQWDED